VFLHDISGGIKNAIAVEGAGVKDELITLSEKKSSVTAFVDGDRGGDLIVKHDGSYSASFSDCWE